MINTTPTQLDNWVKVELHNGNAMAGRLTIHQHPVGNPLMQVDIYVDAAEISATKVFFPSNLNRMEATTEKDARAASGRNNQS